MIKNILLITLFSILSACALTNNKDSQNLNASLLNWQNVYNDGEAKIVDNEIHLISTGNWFYLTKKKYSDFIFEADILMPDVTEYSNSGFIFI